VNSKRGRQSGAELRTPRPVEVFPRLALPPELSGDEAEEFLRLINAQEAGWFAAGSVALLVQLCRHTIQARRLAELIERAVGQPGTGWDYYRQLLVQQRGESAAIAALSTKLRLSAQSQRNDRGNPKGAALSAVPWEYKPQ
jgi:hypothetical protein